MIRIDMDMPDKCSECVFAHHDTFGFSGSCIVMFGESHIIDFGSKKRQGWCPLHPIETFGDGVCTKSPSGEEERFTLYRDSLAESKKHTATNG